MIRRGLEDRIDLAFCSPLAPGFTGRADEVGRRIVRAFGFRQDSESDHPWAHPVDGLVVHIDLTGSRDDRVIETRRRAGAAKTGNFDDPDARARSAT